MRWSYYFIRKQYNLLPGIFFEYFEAVPHYWVLEILCLTKYMFLIPPQAHPELQLSLIQSEFSQCLLTQTELKKLQDLLRASTLTQIHHKPWDSHG